MIFMFAGSQCPPNMSCVFVTLSRMHGDRPWPVASETPCDHLMAKGTMRFGVFTETLLGLLEISEMALCLLEF